MTRLLGTGVALLLSLPACGFITFTPPGGTTTTATDGGPAGTSDAGNPGTGSTPTAAKAKSALNAPLGAAQVGNAAATEGADAVWLATRATGGTTLTVTGTLTQDSAGNWAYAAGGSSLDLHFSTGVVNQFTFTSFNGDFTGTSRYFLDKPHNLQFRFVNPDKADVQVAEVLTTSGVQSSFQGWFVDDAGTRWTSDLSYQGTFSGTVDYNWASYEKNLAMTGTTSGGGTAVTVNETLWSRSQYQSGTLAQNVIRTVNDGWTDGAGTWSVQNFSTHQAYVNQRPGDLTYWAAAGNILLNGAPVGSVRLQQSALTLDVMLDLNGESTVLESHPAQ